MTTSWGWCLRHWRKVESWIAGKFWKTSFEKKLIIGFCQGKFHWLSSAKNVRHEFFNGNFQRDKKTLNTIKPPTTPTCAPVSIQSIKFLLILFYVLTEFQQKVIWVFCVDYSYNHTEKIYESILWVARKRKSSVSCLVKCSESGWNGFSFLAEQLLKEI